MPVKIDRSGLDKLVKNAKELHGTHEVKLVDLMDPVFVSGHSKFANLESLFSASGFKLDTPEDFAAIPDDEWDTFIRGNTDFSDWEEMQQSANVAYVKKKLNQGL